MRNGEEYRSRAIQPSKPALPREKVIVVLVLLLAALLRLTYLDRYPAPIHQDELSDIYDGYCLATDGHDRHGDVWPAIIHGMGPGDYHPGMYAYLAAISTRIGGFSVVAGRLPAALVGILIVWLVYRAGRRLLGPAGGVVAMLFACWSPVLILYGRQGHEGGCLPPLFGILIVGLLWRWLHERELARPHATLWLAVSGLAIGLSTNAYASQRLTAIGFCLAAVVLLVWFDLLRNRRPARLCGHLVVLAITVGFGAAPQLYAAVTQPEQFFARSQHLIPPLAFGPRWWLTKVLTDLAANLDPRHLFLQFGEYSELSIGRLNVVGMPFFYLGLLMLIIGLATNKRGQAGLLLAAVVIGLAPALLCEPNPSTMRASTIWGLYPVIMAVGVMVFLAPLARVDRSKATRRGTLHGPALGVVTLGLCINGAINLVAYLEHPQWQRFPYQNHLVRLAEWTAANDDGYDRIYVDAPGHFAYLYFAAFTGMSPAEYRAAPREGIVSSDGWEKFDRFGRFYFAGREAAQDDWEHANQGERWLLVSISPTFDSVAGELTGDDFEVEVLEGDAESLDHSEEPVVDPSVIANAG